MTKLGIYLTQKSVNKAEVSRRTGINKSRMTQLSNNVNTKLTAEELYKIALSISVNPCELLNVVCAGTTLKDEQPIKSDK
jgi:hypothetical protein